MNCTGSRPQLETAGVVSTRDWRHASVICADAACSASSYSSPRIPITNDLVVIVGHAGTIHSTDSVSPKYTIIRTTYPCYSSQKHMANHHRIVLTMRLLIADEG